MVSRCRRYVPYQSAVHGQSFCIDFVSVAVKVQMQSLSILIELHQFFASISASNYSTENPVVNLFRLVLNIAWMAGGHDY